MPSIRLTWSLPLTRESGKPLKPEDIAGYAIERSFDGGAFERLPDAPADTTSALIPAVEPGEYRFRVACFDTRNRTGAFATGAAVIEDDSPPGLVLDLRVEIEVDIPTRES